MNRTKMTTAPLALAFLSLVACQPALGQDTSFKIFGALSRVSPLSEGDASIGGVRDSLATADKFGWDLGLELRPGKVLGIELDYLKVTQDVKFGGITIGGVDMSPLSSSLNLHFIHTTIIDLYAGPTFSWVNWGKVHLNSTGSGVAGSSQLTTDNETAWGASLGIDVGLGKNVAVIGGLRWLNLDLATNGQGVPVSPLFSRVGLALRW
jgi:opacity protein-like surface antigen